MLSGQDCVGGSDCRNAADAFSPNPQPLRLTLRRGSTVPASLIMMWIWLTLARALGCLKPWERLPSKRPDPHEKTQASVRTLGFYRLLPQPEALFNPGGVFWGIEAHRVVSGPPQQ